VRTTKNPKTLQTLGTFWIGEGGVNLGVIGDDAHLKKGFSYHLGKSELKAGATSNKLDRDRTGLTEAASAIDLGLLHNRKSQLRAFSKWLVARCLADPVAHRDIREIIYTADGATVQRYDGTVNKILTKGDQGDDSHLDHTHISFFRDSEKNDKVKLFKPFFSPVWAADVPAELQAVDPSAKKVAMAIRVFGHEFGGAINLADLEVGMKKAEHDFGLTVNPGDVVKLLALAAKKK
jgi:hypothetical protein